MNRSGWKTTPSSPRDGPGLQKGPGSFEKSARWQIYQINIVNGHCTTDVRVRYEKKNCIEEKKISTYKLHFDRTSSKCRLWTLLWWTLGQLGLLVSNEYVFPEQRFHTCKCFSVRNSVLSYKTDPLPSNDSSRLRRWCFYSHTRILFFAVSVGRVKFLLGTNNQSIFIEINVPDNTTPHLKFLATRLSVLIGLVFTSQVWRSLLYAI